MASLQFSTIMNGIMYVFDSSVEQKKMLEISRRVHAYVYDKTKKLKIIYYSVVC